MITTTPHVLTRNVHYHPSGDVILKHLTAKQLIPTTQTADGRLRPCDTVLLETADTSTHASRTSIILLAANARLTCNQDTVQVQPLAAGDDGISVVQRLRHALAEYVVDTPDSVQNSASLTLTFPPAQNEYLEERQRLRTPSTLEPLRTLAKAKVNHPHLPLEMGVFAFDYLATFEALPPVTTGANTCPDYVFYDARIILVLDHPSATATLVGASTNEAQLAAKLSELADAINALDSSTAAIPSQTKPQATLKAVPSVSDAEFSAQVQQLKAEIDAGEIYQVVPARGFSLPCPDALAAYSQLRAANPSPYMFYAAFPEFEIFGASPESALAYSAKTQQLFIRPIAGTRPRALTPAGAIDHEYDTRLELDLRTDPKEVAEHVMLVDLARNDVARVSKPRTRRVNYLMHVDRYSRVMHLVSEVVGELDPQLDALDALRACMSMGTLTGAPKLRAAELIRKLERVRRGSYGGFVGYFRGDGELDTCIVIRSAFVANGQALVQAGAGVVSASDPQAEAAETLHKASAVLLAIAAAQAAKLVFPTPQAEAASTHLTEANHARCSAR